MKNRPLKRLELPPEKPLATEVREDVVPQQQLSPAVIKSLNVPVLFPKSSEPQILPKIERNITRIIPVG